MEPHLLSGEGDAFDDAKTQKIRIAYRKKAFPILNEWESDKYI